MSIKLNAQSGGSVALDAPTQTTSSADLTFKLPVADGSTGQVLKSDGSGNLGFTSLVSGITELDQWVMTGNHSADSGSVLNNNLSRLNTSNYAGASAQIGTGMTKDSATGIFTFPSTGKWIIFYTVQMYLQGDDNAGLSCSVSTDGGSNFNYNALAYTGGNAGNTAQSASSIAFIDVTNTSNVKVRFQPDGLGTDSYITGNSSYVRTSFTFVRIGDT